MAAAITATSAAADAQARTSALVAQHGPGLLRVARRVSLCSDDAHDAFQRALEIYLRRLDTIDPRTEAAWMRVVVRNEALAVRRSRSQLVGSEDVDLDAHVDDAQRSTQERVESAERVTRSAEALRALRPDEAHALLLKAEGLSYAEIGEQLNWTYTKVNRCITEGRARFRKAFAVIESGEQCERFAPLLLALVEGEADADTLIRLKPHLRHCSACRAEVRRLHGSRWSSVGAWLPLPGLLDRFKPSAIKAELYGLFSRLGGVDPATGPLAGTGGARSAGATALVGLCLAGAGAGGYCALGGPLPELPGSAKAVRENAPRKARAAAGPSPAAAPGTPVGIPFAAPKTESTATATPTTTERNAERAETAAATTDAGSDEFSFEAAAATPARTPAPAPVPAPSEETQPAPSPTAEPAEAQPATAEPRATEPAGEFGFER